MPDFGGPWPESTPAIAYGYLPFVMPVCWYLSIADR